jgi:hypothetical protein
VYFSERKKKRAWDRQSEAWNKGSTVSTKNQMLEVIPEKGKMEMEAMCIVFIYIYVELVYIFMRRNLGTLVHCYIRLP